MSDEIYWASEDAEKMPDLIRQRVIEYVDWLEITGRLAVWRRSVIAYHGLDTNGGWAESSAVRYGGATGELVELVINQYRSLAQHIHVLTTQSRPAFRARATNTDHESQAQATLADGILEYQYGEMGQEDGCIRAAELALVYAEGWFDQRWDANAGKQVQQEPQFDEMGQPIEAPPKYEGDIKSLAIGPYDVIRDPDVFGEDHNWLIIRRWENRWDLAAIYPDKADAIHRVAKDPGVREGLWDSRALALTRERQRDLIPCYELMHKRTPAVPNGRIVLVCGDATLLHGDLPYDDIPIIPMIPSLEIEGGRGYSTLWDLIGPQQALNSVVSTMLTNHDAVGVQKVWCKEGDEIRPEQISDGMVMLRSLNKPEALQLTEVSEHSYKLEELLNKYCELISGINSVSRGQPDPSLKSGAALALVQSMAIQYNSGYQRAYNRLLERSGTTTIQIFKRYASSPRVAEIAGKTQQPMLKSFTGNDIGAVHRVSVETVNPVMRTTSGRLELAEKLVAMPDAQREQYIQVLQTGRIEPITEGVTAEALYIREENEALSSGEKPRVSRMDNHPWHISEHKAVLMSKDARTNQPLLEATIAHIQEHEQFMQPAMPPAGPPGAPHPPQGGPPPGGHPDEPQKAPKPDVPGTNDQQAAQLPSMPKNPLTGEHAQPNGAEQA